MQNNTGDPYGQAQPQNCFYSQPQMSYYNGQPRAQQAGNPFANQQYAINTPSAPRIIDYVQGELAASIYPINFCPQEVYLIDPDLGFVYSRNRDASGKLSPLIKYKLVPADEDADKSQYVKSDEILDIIAEAVQNEVEKKLSEISFKPSSDERKGR